MLPWWSLPEASIEPIADAPPAREDTAVDPMIATPAAPPPPGPAAAPVPDDDSGAPVPAPFLYPPFPDINDGSIMETYDEPTYTVNPFFLDWILAEEPQEPAPAPAPPSTPAPDEIAPDEDDNRSDSPIFTPTPSPSPPPPPELVAVLLPTAVEEPRTPSLASSPPTEVPSLVLDASSPLSTPWTGTRGFHNPWDRDIFYGVHHDADDRMESHASDHDDGMEEDEDEEEDEDRDPAEPMPVIPVIAKKTFQPPKPVPSGQWRVGKTPGHQGSHLRAKRKAEDDSESKDVFPSPAKVLRKPFRPPTRIVPLAPAPRPTAVPHAKADAAVDTFPDSTAPPSSSAGSSPTLHRSRTKRAGKPFAPLTPGSAPTPTRQHSGPRSRRDPDADLCTALEARIRTLKSALKYSSNPDEDDRVAQLVHTWRDAGREVADRLFSLLPPPAEQARRSEAWGWDRDAGSGRDLGLFADSGLGDGDGKLDNDGDDLERLLDDASRPRTRASFGLGMGHDTHRVAWHKGAMLLQLGVDPILFGWNESEDDWDEIDDL